MTAVVNCVCAQRSSNARGVSAYRTFSIYTDAATSSLADLRALVAARVGAEFVFTPQTLRTTASVAPSLGVFRIDEDLSPHDVRLLHAERNPRHLFRLTELPDSAGGLLKVWVPRIGDKAALHILVTVADAGEQLAWPASPSSSSASSSASLLGGLAGKEQSWSPYSGSPPSPSTPLISSPPRALPPSTTTTTTTGPWVGSSPAGSARLPNGLLWSPPATADQAPRDIHYSPPRIDTKLSAATRTTTQRSSAGYYDIADAYCASLARSATTTTSMTTIIPPVRHHEEAMAVEDDAASRAASVATSNNSRAVKHEASLKDPRVASLAATAHLQIAKPKSSLKVTNPNPSWVSSQQSSLRVPSPKEPRTVSVLTNQFRAAKHEPSLTKKDRTASVATNQFRDPKFVSMTSAATTTRPSLGKDASMWARLVAFVRTRRGKVVVSMIISVLLLVAVVKTMLTLGTVKKPAGAAAAQSGTPSPSTPIVPTAMPFPNTVPAAGQFPPAASLPVASPTGSTPIPSATVASAAAWPTLAGLQFIGSFSSPPNTTTINTKTLAGCASACVAMASLTGCIAAQLVDNGTSCLLMSSFSGLATQNTGASIAFPPLSSATFAAWTAASVANSDHVGDDLDTVAGFCPLATSAVQCASLCALVPTCAGLTFSAADGCCFKSNVATTTAADGVTLFKKP
ncbi:hypothetical protein HDU87_002285 [Geranomyces variabilis]|uniref:Uncharacterized protein n=1 Tax=Geranomyces variabilis TaxID=109894 RepID=A0AAD5XNV9_9FUNG|nr:hypothetical protein HDU87_002285 [Geranomyces variabilis]